MTKINKAEAKTDIKINIPAVFKIVESKAEGEKGIVEAYVSIFDNIDLVGDIIRKGAFAESLAKKLPKGVWSHNWDEPIAKTLEAREDDKGLFIKGQFIEGVQRADEAYKLIKGGVIDEFSIGFRVLDDEWTEEGIRIITKARIYEWSPVLVGANPDTELISIKGQKPEKKCEEVKAKAGDACEMPDGSEGEMMENEDGEMVCVMKKAKKSENIRKVDFVKVDEEKGTVELFYRENGEKKSEVLEMSDKFKKYQSELKAHKQKVEADDGEGVATREKILRIRQVAKQNLKSSQYLLRITK